VATMRVFLLLCRKRAALYVTAFVTAITVLGIWVVPKVQSIRYRRRLDFSAETGERVSILRRIASRGSRTSAAAAARGYVGETFKGNPSYGMGLVVAAKELWLDLGADELIQCLGRPHKAGSSLLAWRATQAGAGITKTLTVTIQNGRAVSVILSSELSSVNESSPIGNVAETHRRDASQNPPTDDNPAPDAPARPPDNDD